MKTFTTSGTGSQQTLSELETDKLPLYNSLADAEADLANLEENQIVATKDTGDELAQPVDTVEAGNLHAVTSNAVAVRLCTINTPPFNSDYILWAREIYNPITKVVTILARVKDGTSPVLGQDLVFPIHKGNNDFYPIADVRIIKYFEQSHRILLRGVNYVLQVDSISDVNTQIEISYIAE